MDKMNALLREERVFEASASFKKIANISDKSSLDKMRADSLENPTKFWGDLGDKELYWFKKPEQTLKWDAPYAQWFVGGETNVSYNCLDRVIENGGGDRTAIVWEGEPGDIRKYTYKELLAEVCRCANVLRDLGVNKGDAVGIYLPMIPEAAIAMLACARIGAVHTVVFGGFSGEALKDRLQDAQAKVLVTADGGFRKDQVVNLKAQADIALAENAVPSVSKVLVVQRTKEKIAMQEGRDVYWHETVARASGDLAAVPMGSEDLLFILYTSGTTGKPKGVVHTTAGYNLYAKMTARWVLDLKPDDIYWCTADVGWITGHSYIVYGPLACGATVVMYEGAPRPSNPGAFWEVVERHKVSIFYTAPTAVRSFMKQGDSIPAGYDLSSLRLLGTVGEPINPEAWTWYQNIIGEGRCPIVDTWWQTETGGMMIAPLPGLTATKPGSCTMPLPGIDAAVVDQNGNECDSSEGGYLVIRKPWPGMMRTLFKDSKRFEEVYWSRFKDKEGRPMYFAGDGCRKDEEGYFWLMGRVDDVLNISGHRLGTMEVESALVSHPAVAEAAVVSRPCEVKGKEIFAFVTLKEGVEKGDGLKSSLKNHVVGEIGAIAKPGEIYFTDALPKTRSGKIMRRILKNIASKEVISGDLSTIEDQAALAKLQLEHTNN